MACTTILAGKKATYDGSTIISRNDDCPSGEFHAKRIAVVSPKEQPRHYKSKIGHLSIELPEDPLSYTAAPSVDDSRGIWGASGINSLNVAMTATETITSNPRVLGADPLVDYVPGKNGHPGGIGEEDLVSITLPYIHSAREGVLRLGSLLEQYGTYESNGIAFSDKDEVWWLESIGGHHWIARKVKDEEVVIMPNQFGLDRFDFEDAFGEGEENLCSKDLLEFVKKNHLDLGLEGPFNPRLAFGSHSDSDHVYNTPRAWYLLRSLNGKLCEEGGYGPESDDIPWSFVPEKKITVEDIKYLQSSHYQGTAFDPYVLGTKGKYRPIGISRTSFLAILQIRGYLPAAIQAVEWVGFGSNVYNSVIPLYTNVSKVPAYLANTTLTVDTHSFYWANRLVGALADPHFHTSIVHVERYQEKTLSMAHAHLLKTADLWKEGQAGLEKANEAIAKAYEKETNDLLDKALYDASMHMLNGFSRSDN